MREALWTVITVCLLFACVTDCRTCEVYNFTWWISGTAAAVLILLNGTLKGEMLLELGLFCLLQLLVFTKMYGRADCYAFCVCAMVEAAEGMGFMEFLLHMLLAFGILAPVQLLYHNVDRRGNLKQPVPFLPYITLAFGLVFLIF